MFELVCIKFGRESSCGTFKTKQGAWFYRSQNCTGRSHPGWYGCKFEVRELSAGVKTTVSREKGK